MIGAFGFALAPLVAAPPRLAYHPFSLAVSLPLCVSLSLYLSVPPACHTSHPPCTACECLLTVKVAALTADDVLAAIDSRNNRELVSLLSQDAPCNARGTVSRKREKNLQWEVALYSALYNEWESKQESTAVLGTCSVDLASDWLRW